MAEGPYSLGIPDLSSLTFVVPTQTLLAPWRETPEEREPSSSWGREINPTHTLSYLCLLHGVASPGQQTALRKSPSQDHSTGALPEPLRGELCRELDQEMKTLREILCCLGLFEVEESGP